MEFGQDVIWDLRTINAKSNAYNTFKNTFRKFIISHRWHVTIGGLIADVRPEAWRSISSNLAKSHNGQTTVIILLDILRDPTHDSENQWLTIREIRGAMSARSLFLLCCFLLYSSHGRVGNACQEMHTLCSVIIPFPSCREPFTWAQLSPRIFPIIISISYLSEVIWNLDWLVQVKLCHTFAESSMIGWPESCASWDTWGCGRVTQPSICLKVQSLRLST